VHDNYVRQVYMSTSNVSSGLCMYTSDTPIRLKTNTYSLINHEILNL